jgi:hypothetical protein
VRTAAPRLVLAGTTQLPATIVTVIADSAPDRILASSVGADETGPIRVYGTDWEDWLLVRGFAGAGAGSLESDALLAAWRHRDGTFVADGRVGGTFQRQRN